ncbi:MAG: hypothetical protein ABI303_00420 [Candidatus Saccharimonas sp.]
MNNGSTYDGTDTDSETTLDHLIGALQGTMDKSRAAKLAKSLGTEISAISPRIEYQRQLWPTAEELCSMWDKLPNKEQAKLVVQTQWHIRYGHIIPTDKLLDRMQIADLRDQATKAKEEHRKSLMANGLPPEESLRCLMEDLGVKHLACTVGNGDPYSRSHFDFSNLDPEIMEELFAGGGIRASVELRATKTGPDGYFDSSGRQLKELPQNWSSPESDWSPFVWLDRQRYSIISVSWDEAKDGFILTLRSNPLGGSNKCIEDKELSIAELRRYIGWGTKLGRPLRVGEKPNWDGINWPLSMIKH